MRTPRRTALTIAATVVAALLVSGCSEDETAPAIQTQNSADVAFAQAMIPHHAQALEMVAMTEGRELSPDFEHLTGHVHDAQGPEVDTMTEWLEEWGEDAPSGHVHHEGMDMTGMVAPADLTALGATPSDRAFERRWLRLMIAHHEGAIDMAKDEIAKGSYRPALDLAAAIVTAQSHEIDEMREMLRS